MSAELISLLADADRRILEAYFFGTQDPSLEAVFDAIGVSDEAFVPRLEVAVAQVLLYWTQDDLPQISVVDEDGDLVVGRHAFGRAEPVGRLRFAADFLFCLNWADSGPGLSWPEAYHLFRVPGFERYVVTVSRDSDEGAGCCDNVIGHCSAELAPREAARQIVQAWWTFCLEDVEQTRWAYLFEEGLIDRAEAQVWADEVWRDAEEDEDEEGDEEDEEDEEEARDEHQDDTPGRERQERK